MLLPVLSAGPGGGGGAGGPPFAPQDAAQAALAEYDANKDGLLDAKELERCPAPQGGLKAFDKNGHGKLSADEIAGRLTFYQVSKVKLTSLDLQLIQGGGPPEGATVTLEPEKFLGPGARPASGVSDAEGQVSLAVEGEQTGLVPLGLYRVQVSKKDAKGEELIPARYNTKTTLGAEVGPDLRGGLTLQLSRK